MDLPRFAPELNILKSNSMAIATKYGFEQQTALFSTRSIVYSASGLLGYSFHYDTDCNYYHNIHGHHRETDGPLGPDKETCKIWCSLNPNCGGFVASENRCFFKDFTCDTNLFRLNNPNKWYHAYVKVL